VCVYVCVHSCIMVDQLSVIFFYVLGTVDSVIMWTEHIYIHKFVLIDKQFAHHILKPELKKIMDPPNSFYLPTNAYIFYTRGIYAHTIHSLGNMSVSASSYVVNDPLYL